MARIDEVHGELVRYYFQDNPTTLVNGIGIGYLSRNDSPEILVFVDPSAAECEREAIDLKVGREPHRLLRASRFVGLQAATGSSVSAHDPLRYNVAPMSTGTFGAVVKAGGRQYILGSNHVLGDNGRVARDAPVVIPGPLDDANAGAIVGKRSHVVELKSPGWPTNGATANLVDCALGEVTGAVNASTAVPVLSLPDPTPPFPVTKTGRTTLTTHSQVKIFHFHGLIDFSFGMFYFKELMGTFDDDHSVFAAPGDSGGVAVDDQGRGVGLITARGYVFNRSDEFIAYIMCRLDKVRDALAVPGLLGIPPTQITFFR